MKLEKAAAILKCQPNQVKFRLKSMCNLRLGITPRRHTDMCYSLNVIPNVVKRQEDRRNFVDEMILKKVCAKLKVNKENIKNRLLTGGNVPLNKFQKGRIKEYLGIKGIMPVSNKVKRKYAKIIELWGKGYTYQDIAKKIDTTVGATITIVNRLRSKTKEDILPKRNPFGIVNDKGYNPVNIRGLIQKGMTLEQLAKRFKKDKEYMRSILCQWRYKHPDLKIPHV